MRLEGICPTSRVSSNVVLGIIGLCVTKTSLHPTSLGISIYRDLQFGNNG